MIVFPNCKINIGLKVLRKRSDGYHDLQSVFYPLPFYDILEIVASASSDDLVFTSSGLPIDGQLPDNLCVKAYHLIKKDFPGIPPIALHLHKTIPMGAGLGGGSSDAIFALKSINEKFELGLSGDRLLNYALQLGSDCPFFLLNKPCLASGRGDVLAPIELSLGRYQVVLVNPGIHVRTANAFSQVTPSNPGISLAELVTEPVERWKDTVTNDFEAPVFRQFPEIQKIKEELYMHGAIYAAMTGSGSSVYGIFEKDRINVPAFPPHYLVRTLAGQL